MNKSVKFSAEVRERAVRIVQEHRGDYPSLWAGVESIGFCRKALLKTQWVMRLSGHTR
ncbi:hypothetical protein ACQUFY_25190 (plasmid) [Robbsia andropogonis]|uniref:hypothetical protein n=1 Tax=Robbsia andropogonis TaxID=28092 RepID=UPI003D1AEF69